MFHYDRLCIVPLEEVLPHLTDEKPYGTIRATIRDHSVKVNSLRLVNFMQRQDCAICGIKATHFALEKDAVATHYHLNMYALKEGNKKNGYKWVEVLMTHDHIIPKVAGGPNTIDNTVTMCSTCNGKKGDKLPEGFVLLEENDYRLKPHEINAFLAGVNKGKSMLADIYGM